MNGTSEGSRSLPVLADAGCGPDEEPRGLRSKYSRVDLLRLSPAARALHGFYQDPKNARDFIAWCEERGRDVEAAAPAWVRELAARA